MSDVSVVIATYNRAELLEQAVESVLRQSVPPLEVIIVNDGSTDNTPNVCARLGPPVRTIRVPNGGVASARNIGIAAARGTWVALLDSDDTWMSTKLEVQLAALTAFPTAEWSITGCELRDADGRLVSGAQSFAGAFPVFRDLSLDPVAAFDRGMARRELEAAGRHHRCYGGDFFPLLLLGNMGLPSSLLVRRRAFEKVGMFDPTLRLAEETEFFLRIATAYPTVVVMTPLVQYRLAQADSLTSSANSVALSTAALRAVDAAVARRDRLTNVERTAWRAGRRNLLLRLAYAELSEYHNATARRALAQVFREGSLRDPRAVALWILSLAPPSVLRALHFMKRRLRALTRPHIPA